MAWDDIKDFGDLISESDWNDMVSDQKTRVAGDGVDDVLADTASNLPAAGQGNRVFFETDTGRVLYDNGSSWVEVGLSESEISLANLGSNDHSDLSGVVSDNHHVKTTDMDDLNDVTGVTSFEENTSGNLPSAGTEGRIFFETDTGRILYDDGTSWIEIGLSESQITLGQLNSLDAGSQRITGVASPNNDNDAVNKSYADAIEQGLNLKEAVRAASDGADVDLASTVDPNPIDGVTLNDGDRVLLKDQTDGTENGLYDAVTATDPTTWTRTADFNEDAEVTSGSFTFVEEGGVNGNDGYVITTEDPITLGSTSISWTQFSGAGQITAGDGIVKNGERLDVRLDIEDDGVDVAQAYGIDFAGGDFAVTDDADDTVTVALTDDSLSVAGNTVSLGGSTTVDYVDLNDTGSSFPIPNSDLSNSSVTVAGNSVLLGGSTGISYSDLSDTAASFPIPNGDLANSSISVAGNSVSLGGSTTPEVTDFNGSNGSAGQILKTDGSNLFFGDVNTETVTHVSSNYTTSGETTILLDSIVDVTLSSIDASESGKIVRVVDTTGTAGSNTVTIDTESAETINGESSAVINSDYEALTFQSDGSDWYITSRMSGGGV